MTQSETAAHWEFWIDVGGTFTDCLARRPDGTIATHKLLSTGIYKGKVDEGSTPDYIVDPQRRCDPSGFFDGFTLSVGEESVPVTRCEAETGMIVLERSLGTAPPVGTSYELRSAEEAPVTGIRWLMGKQLTDAVRELRIGGWIGTRIAANWRLIHHDWFKFWPRHL